MQNDPFEGLSVERAVAGPVPWALLSDFDLLRAAARVIAVPKRGEPSSFEIHAPLELLARYQLLPFVAPADRDLVRLQIVVSALLYRAAGTAVAEATTAASVPTRPADLVLELERAMAAGEVDQSDAVFTALTRIADPMTVLGALALPALRTLAHAAHTHIGLMLLARAWGDALAEVLQLGRAGVRALAAAPRLNLAPTAGPGRLDHLTDALKAVPKTAFPEFTVLAMVRAPEQAGCMDAVIGDGLLKGTAPIGWEDAIRTTCRVAAASMLHDAPDGAKYGWTHALTMPQAAWFLAHLLPDPAFRLQAAQSSLSWLIAFRATLGNGGLNIPAELPRGDGKITTALYESPAAAAAVAWHTPVADRAGLVRVLATEAAIRIDAHLVKYVRACFDAARLDPTQAHLYLASAAYLCALWCCEQPRSGIREMLAAPRS